MRPAEQGVELRTVTAAMALAQRGTTMREARDAFDRMLRDGKAGIRLTGIENANTLATELRACGIASAVQIVPTSAPKQAPKKHVVRRQEHGQEEIG